jgi:methylenetetrahydrofolate reductase (NADPH)
MSYLSRTATWDEFPNGRWGDARSPAFGDLSDYHLCSFKTGKPADRRAIWGDAPKTLSDVYEVFARYIEGTVPRLPWCEEPVKLETIPLKERLARMNRAGLLTINSQPRVNGAPSSDPAVGWGAPNGYVYQKAYLEFFVSPQGLERFEVLAKKFPSLTYYATNARGDLQTNVDATHVKATNAVTWGVFPASEVKQPTVMDPQSFLVWKDEAFALWRSQWQSIYPANSESWKLLQSIVDTFWLVNVVDNDFVKGDIFDIFDQLLPLQ